ncbi:restriction endonuclease subunit S, partial [Senegalia sp. (in: firmicutes)]|uniref:restriction endonuclease subunit S n=1 Tax=Senegalia sp. (in: firmicutes) TaxID=1924098 RepID=UPI003F96D21D
MYELKYRNKDEMKDSGVEWLGDVPREWEVKKLKHVSICLDGKRVPLSSQEREKIQGIYPYWGANGVVDYINDYLIDSEVILLGEDGAPFFDNYKNVAFLIKGRVWVNNHIHILEPRNINSSFLLNCLNTVDYKNYIKGSTRDKLTQTDMKEIFIQYPCFLEQQKIANFLDIKTSQFDSIISKKEKLIEKLEEAKKSLISEVVTGKVKIVDGKMIERKEDEMKDSGVEWLGMIAKDWEVKKLKYLMDINPPKSEVINKNIKCNFVPMNKIHNGIIETEDIKLVKEVYDGYTYFKDQDIVMAKVTPCYENGDIAIAKNLKNGIAFGTTEINVFRIYDNTEFTYYLMQDLHFIRYGSSHMTGVAGLKRVPTSYFENYKTAIPSKKEQNNITNFLNTKTTKLDKIITKTKSQIQKLKEAKQS